MLPVSCPNISITRNHLENMSGRHSDDTTSETMALECCMCREINADSSDKYLVDSVSEVRLRVHRSKDAPNFFEYVAEN